MRLTAAALLTLALADIAMSQSHPNTYVNTADLAAIRAKVQASQQPWKRAYDETIADANAALNQSPIGVTSQGSTSHDYYTERPYDWSNNMPSPCGATYCDGQINPLADRADYSAATTICRAIRDLGMAYALTGDARYADKAIVLINAWCLDDATYMNARYPGSQSYIELSITIPGMFYGADLIYPYAGWDTADRSAFLQWAADFTQSALGWSRTNNFENWRLVVLATGGALTDNQTVLNTCFARWREIIPDQVSAAGAMTQELGRTKSLDYSTYAVSPMLQTAEIARHRGVDLYHYTTGGRGLELVLDYHAPYVITPSTWPYEQISAYNGANLAVYECAYAVYQKQAYLDVVNRWGRPMYESRVMGYTTLTHAFGLDVTPVAAMPQIAPAGGEFVGAVQVTLTCATDGAEVRYTTDGSEPTAGSPLYTAPFTVTASATVKARAFHQDMDPSETATASFVVTVDNEPPSVVSVSAVGDSTRVRVVFDEMVAQASAANAANYAVSPGVSVTGAVLEADARTVVLAVSALEEGVAYTLTVSSVADRASPPNTRAQQQVAFEFQAGLMDDFEDGGRLSWQPKTVSRWSIEADDGDDSYHLNTTDFSNDGDMLGEYALLAGHTFGDLTLTVSVRSDETAANNAADGAIVFGYEDAANYYYVMLNSSAQWNEVFQVVDGARTSLVTATSAWLPLDRYAVVTLTVEGQDLAVVVDGQPAMSATLPTAPVGSVGLGAYNDAVFFDDFLLVPGATGVVQSAPASVRPSPRRTPATPARMFDLAGRMARHGSRSERLTRGVMVVVEERRGQRCLILR